MTAPKDRIGIGERSEEEEEGTDRRVVMARTKEDTLLHTGTK